MVSKKTADYDAVVVGAGFRGVRALWELNQLGLSAKCYEAGSDVGGAWYWNRYPGARTDGEAWVYIMNFAPELRDDWDYTERYPSQEEVQRYLCRIVDRFDLRRQIEFGTRVVDATYNESENIWTITGADGLSTTCRYFIAATGSLSVAQKPPFPGLDSYTGEWYETSNWPAHDIDFRNKHIAVIGTGSTGSQVIPKLAPIAKQLTVFQRTPNYVLPGRNYNIDQYQADNIKQNMDATWKLATEHMSGLALKSAGRTVKGEPDADKIRRIFDYGWERGCYPLQLETFDDIIMDPESNEVFSEYVRQMIRAIVQDPDTADLLCPRHPFGSKRPPCGHFYYEAYNRPNVKLVDISRDDIDLYEKGIRTTSGAEYEFDIIIFALGFDTATGALSQLDVKGSQGILLKDHWNQELRTFAGVLVSGFPNMFMVCGPHTPLGNLPVMLDISVNWIGKTIRHMEENHLRKINVTEKAVKDWSQHNYGIFNSTWFPEPAKATRSWGIGANIPGKPHNVLYYFGGVPSWTSWLNNEADTAWANMEFTPADATADVSEDTLDQHTSAHVTSVTAEMLESVVFPLQSDTIGISPTEKFNRVSAAVARYFDWAVKGMHDRGLAPKQDHRIYWWKAIEDFVQSEEGQARIQKSPSTQDELGKLTSRLGVEGEAISRIGPEIVRLLTGKTNPLAHILKDDLLFRMYLSDEGARPNRYMAEYAKILTSQKKNLRILEIGAGTGGTTLQILQACSPEGKSFCSEYVFTDISPGFFKTGRTTLKKWEHLLTFQTLNVESDPVKQRFEEHAYDLIIAANVVYATRSLNKSLRTVHKLLKPGGVFGLVELTRLSPYFTMAFGPLSGWWAGVDEGRTGSSLQTAEQWDEQLRKAGFSGIDVAAYDLPEPERHSALLLSTALAL